MKTAFFSIALLGFLIACDHQENALPHTSGEFKVAYQKSVHLTGTSLGMKVVQVSDCRCPINARCITAGWVKVDFEVSSEGKAETIQLELPAYPDHSVQKTFWVGGQSYQLSLGEVLPYPEAGKAIQLGDYSVEFAVVKQ